MSDFPVAVTFVIVVSFWGLILKLISVDVRKQNCNIGFKLINGFDTVLGPSELVVNFR